MEAGSSAAERSIAEPTEYYKVVIGDNAQHEQVPPYYAVQSGTVDLPPPPYEIIQTPQQQQQHQQQQSFESSSSRNSNGSHSDNTKKRCRSFAWCMGLWINALKADHRLACCGCFACCFLLVLTLVFVSVFFILPQKSSTTTSS